MNHDKIENMIMNPQYCVSPFWFWNDYIEDSALTEQIKLMAEAGYKQPIIHARHGLELEYLSDSWFDRFRHAISQAKEHGMKIWVYDENNWPSGNCNGIVTRNVRNREHFLLIDEISLVAGESLVLPENNRDIESVSYIDVVMYENDDIERKNLLKDIGIRNLDSFIAKTNCIIYIVRVAVNIYDPFGALAVDYMSKDAIASFIKLTHEQYANNFANEFGDTISGFFMDETRFLNMLPWTMSFPDEFVKRKGYDIIPKLHLLLRNDKVSRLIRYDYYDVVASLVQENTFKQVYDWCETHSVQLIGHVLGEETMASQSRFNGDIMRLYRYIHIPSIDHLGNGIGSLNAKICSSAAHNYGKLIVGCESFGACGWSMTYEELVKISNWLFQQGINHIVLHGFYYSIRDERKNDWPPSYFYQWKDWDKMQAYAEMSARMCQLLQGSVNETDLLVYYPVETFWACYEPQFETITCYFKEGPQIKNDQAKKIDHEFQSLCSSLLNANFDFEVLNSDAANCFYVENGRLVNKHTTASYNSIILPCTQMIPSSVVDLLNQFSKEGGKVITFQSPLSDVLGINGEHINNPELLPVLSKESFIKAESINDVVRYCSSNLHRSFEIIEGIGCLSRTQMSYPDRLHDPYLHDGEQQYGVGVTSYIKDKKRILNFTNFNSKDEILTVRVKSSDLPTIYYPEDGSSIPATDSIVVDGMYTIKIILPKNRAVFVLCAYEDV